jgi:hypothetical protein
MLIDLDLISCIEATDTSKKDRMELLFRDMMAWGTIPCFFVVLLLNRSPPLRFVNGPGHAVGQVIRVEDGLAPERVALPVPSSESAIAPLGKKPSLSASKIATRETSGRSSLP